MKIFQSVKNVFHNYIEANTYQSRTMAKIENIFSRTSLISYHNFNDYRNQKRENRNIWPCIFGRLIMVVYCLKFIIPVVFNTEWAKWMTCEFCYIIGNPIIISTTLSFCIFIALILNIYILYEEWNQSLYVLDFMDEIKNNSLDLKLSPKNQRKFCLKINLLIDCIINIVFPLLVIFVSFMFISSLIIAYMDPNTGYSLIMTIFWSVITIVWSYYFYSVCVSIAIVLYLTTVFLKYKFNEINESFINSFKFRNKTYFFRTLNITIDSLLLLIN